MMMVQEDKEWVGLSVCLTHRLGGRLLGGGFVALDNFACNPRLFSLISTQCEGLLVCYYTSSFGVKHSNFVTHANFPN